MGLGILRWLLTIQRHHLEKHVDVMEVRSTCESQMIEDLVVDGEVIRWCTEIVAYIPNQYRWREEG